MSFITMRPSLVISLFLLSSTTAFSQEQPATSTSTAPNPVKVRKLSLRPTDAPYPKELASAGVQGTSEVLVTLGADGAPSAVSISQTSRSEKLDLAAIDLVKTLSFKVNAATPSAPPPQVLVPVEFLRDTASTLPQKLCKEFNVDLEYFKTTFPEKMPQDMTVIKMSVGYLALSGKPSMEKQIALAKSLNEVVPSTVSACAAQPDSKFFEVFKQAVNEVTSKNGG
ncbi:TonB family protein [Azonexus sp.]|uniref:TonB family protein n=1 Tax=Azonexus sp. TaxID=1872668 RepID=UPI0035AFDE90